jgi:hypothetical protein
MDTKTKEWIDKALIEFDEDVFYMQFAAVNNRRILNEYKVRCFLEAKLKELAEFKLATEDIKNLILVEDIKVFDMHIFELRFGWDKNSLRNKKGKPNLKFKK